MISCTTNLSSYVISQNFLIKQNIMYSYLYTDSFHIENPHECIQKIKIFTNSHIFEKKCVSLYRANLNIK